MHFLSCILLFPAFFALFLAPVFPSLAEPGASAMPLERPVRKSCQA
jgi:hypothetical protein